MLLRTLSELDAALDHIRGAPTDGGTVELIARRPAIGEREVVTHARLTPEDGLVGDSWSTRTHRRGKRQPPDPNQQLTLMSARAIAAIDPARDAWPLAGDQLYVDLDLGAANLPPGTRLAVGTAVIEVTAEPHLGCVKFTQRFGSNATRWVNSQVGRALNLRGLNARVVTAGDVRTGDRVRKLGTEGARATP